MKTAAKPLALALAIALVPCPGAAEGCGGSTPEALYARFRDLARDGRYDEVLDCLAPDRRAGATAGLLAAAAFTVSVARVQAAGEGDRTDGGADPQAAQAALDGILDRYGLAGVDQETLATLGPAAAVALLDGVDQRALVRELMELLERWGGDEASPTRVDREAGGELTDVAIDGDRATGTVDGEPVYFVRLDGLWYATDGPAGDP